MKIFSKNSKFYLYLFLILGLLIYFLPVILSGFDKFPGINGDTKLILYFLEYSFMHITGAYHSNFFDAPFYYPMHNTLSYSDIMLAGSLVYLPIRLVVSNIFSAFQIWFLIVTLLNYFSFYALCKKLKYSTLVSSFCAFLYTFCVLKYLSIVHLQLHMQFITIFAFIIILNIKRDNSSLENIIHFCAFGALMALQFWTCYQLGWFMCFVFLISFCVSMFSKDLRKTIFDFVSFYKIPIIISSLLFISLVIPLAKCYLATLYSRPIEDSFNYLIVPFDIFRSLSFLDMILFRISIKGIEADISLGFITTLLAIYSIKKLKFSNYIYIALLIIFISICTINYTTYDLLHDFINKIPSSALDFKVFLIKHVPFFSFKNVTLWKLFYNILGASGIRTPARVIHALLPLLFLSFGFMLNKIKSNKVLALIIVFIALEQFPTNSMYQYSKKNIQKTIAHYTEKIPYDCNLFYIECSAINAPEQAHCDNKSAEAMLVSLLIKKPTINGYSGFIIIAPEKNVPKDRYCKIK